MGLTHVPAPRNTIETYSARPDREPTKNEKGEIICTHEQCLGKGEVFRRPCEWNKHMDKHERPYKCSEPTCEQNPGFTYSGGLLRHMREVHKKGVGSKRQPLYCPHQNCIRSTGEGFTRRENLDEHQRRRHANNALYDPNEQSASPPSGRDDNDEQPRKRRKTAESEPPDNAEVQEVQSAQPSQYQVQPPQRKKSDINSEATSPTDPALNHFESMTQQDLVQHLTDARRQIEQQQQLLNEKDEELARIRKVLREHPSALQPVDSSQNQADAEQATPRTNGFTHVITNGNSSNSTPGTPIQENGVLRTPQPESRRISVQNDLLVERPVSRSG